MIKYALVCDDGHEFESWFASSNTYDTQVKRGLVDCPFCGSIKISKALMAPQVSTSRKKEARRQAAFESHVQQVIAQTPAAPDGSNAAKAGPVALLDKDHRKLREAIRELHDKVSENTVDVGDKFAEEARKIHDGEAPQRGIRGRASLEEAKELWDDGVPVLPLPALPKDQN